jgi:hypothetical protein
MMFIIFRDPEKKPSKDRHFRRKIVEKRINPMKSRVLFFFCEQHRYISFTPGSPSTIAALLVLHTHLKRQGNETGKKPRKTVTLQGITTRYRKRMEPQRTKSTMWVSLAIK